jgi:hypothetical protein
MQHHFASTAFLEVVLRGLGIEECVELGPR